MQCGVEMQGSTTTSELDIYLSSNVNTKGACVQCGVAMQGSTTISELDIHLSPSTPVGLNSTAWFIENPGVWGQKEGAGVLQ